MGAAQGPASAKRLEDLPTAGVGAWNGRAGAAAPTLLDLPCDRPRSRAGEYVEGRVEGSLDAALVGALARLGANADSDLSAVLFTGFATLLRRLSRQEELLLGLACSVLRPEGVRQTAVVSMRLEASPGAGFATVLADTGRALREAVAECKQAGVAGRISPAEEGLQPVCEVRAVFDFGSPGPDRPHEPAAPGVAPELRLRAVPRDDGALHLACDFDARLFDAGTIKRWLDALGTLLRSAVEDPGRSWDALDWLSTHERQALVALQPPRLAGDEEVLVHASIAAHAAATPKRIAVSFAGEALDYASLEERANAIAHALRGRGVERGDFIGVCLERGPMLYATVLGILKAGGAFVPLDPDYPSTRLDFMVDDAGLRLLVCSAALAESFDHPSALVLDEDMDEAAWNRCEALPVDPHDANRDSPAYVIYTSGSTGKPKGVVVPHRALANLMRSMQRVPGFGADDRMVAATVSSFDMSIPELFLPLVAGGQVVVAPRNAQRDGYELRRLLETSSATCMQATPSGWRVLLAAGWQGGPRFKALVGGESLPHDLAATLAGCCGEAWNMYGPTETTVWSTCARITPPFDTITIGTPIDNTSVWVLDAHGRPCPLGVPGELWIGGDGVALGYHQRADLTAERFVPDPFDARAGARLYRTGDLGRWRADGALEHFGRMDSQVKVRGYRIELGEIEATLSACDGVSACVATVREDRPGDVRLVAYVVPVPGQAPTPQAMRRQLQARLPAYMVPQRIVAIDALPLSPNGKVDRNALPVPDHGSSANGRIAPRDALQARIAQIVARVLALPGLAVDDDFLALRGEARATVLAAELERELGRPLTLQALLQRSTVAGLASYLGGASMQTPHEDQIDREHCMPNSNADGQQALGPRETYLIGVWADVLGFEVGAADNFFDVGGNSMLAVQMSERVARETGYRIKLMQLAAQSVGEIATDLPAAAAHDAGKASGSGLLRGMKRLFGRQTTTG
ncbi:MAG: amino acid adenylation domain-containing protein [Luteimonas sp.]|nr:amino acid adenylation domain-containing protein [Luteimonas sp.]